MINYNSQTYNSNNLGDTVSVIAAAPTLTPATGQSGTTDPPVGWVFAGIMLILLLMMLYRSIKRFVLKLLKKEQPSSYKRR